MRRLAAELGVPVVETVGVKTGWRARAARVLDADLPGGAALAAIDHAVAGAKRRRYRARPGRGAPHPRPWAPSARTARAERPRRCDRAAPGVRAADPRADPVPGVSGRVRVGAVPMDAIKNGVADDRRLGRRGCCRRACSRICWSTACSPGVGSVLVFLPQIMILFFLHPAPRGRAICRARRSCSTGSWAASGCRAAPSFRCCRVSPAPFPGIMATRTIQNPRDRLATIMIAPLMTCSARLPVYALIIGAFIPRAARGGLELAGPGAVRAVPRWASRARWRSRSC
jgi:ferrous iron transport protein B